MTALQLPELANAWLVVALGIWLQALPFLLLGTLLSAAIAAFVPPGAWVRLLPRHPVLAVPIASLAGTLLPACECASVPMTRSLTRAGVPTAAALAFMTASPAVNPVVIASTAMAYPLLGRMALARFLAGLLASILIGLAWAHWGRPLRGVDECATDAPDPHGHDHHASDTVGSRWQHFRGELVHDLLQSGGGFLVVGAAVAASVKTLVPAAWLGHLTSHLWLEMAAMALLAVMVALCSEADAFMAASLTAFSPTAQLTFLVVGPVVDVKLMAMQGGSFGGRFLARFLPFALAACLCSAGLVGAIVLR